MWVDFGLALAYAFRTLGFFLTIYGDGRFTSRFEYEYFEIFGYTTTLLLVGAIADITLKWVEWQHPPVWSMIFYGVFIAMNHYNA